MRLYVLVTSFRPLRAYISNEGFCRFCTVKYTTSAVSMENMYVHLTNVSLQKRSDSYNDVHGGKWTLANLMMLVEVRQATRRVLRLAFCRTRAQPAPSLPTFVRFVVAYTWRPHSTLAGHAREAGGGSALR
jgi:hypothetical protein